MVKNTISTAWKGALAISFSAILWGLDGVVLTPNLHTLDVFFVVLMLHAIPFGLMSIFLPREFSAIFQFSPKELFALFLASLLGGAAGTIFIVKALFIIDFQPFTIVILLQKLQPVFAITLAAILLKEKPGSKFLLWAGLAISAGYFLTFGLNAPNFNANSTTLVAALFSLAAAFSFGSSTVLSKMALQKIDFVTATFYRYGFTTLIMLITVVFIGKFSTFHQVTGFQWIIFLIIAVTTGSGAIMLYYYGLKKVKAIVATICELFFPLSGILFDYLFYGHQLTYVQWISAAIMVFSILMLNKRPKSVDNAE